MLLDLLRDDAVFLLRWLHVVAAMVWVGSAFALVRLDLAMRPREGGGAAQTLFFNAGAAFRLSRTAEVEAGEPALHFKFEAYATWVSGFALVCLIYCAEPRLYLIDPRLWDAPPWAAITVALAALPLVWLAYDIFYKRSGLAGDASVAVLLVFCAALSAALCVLFAGRAAFPLIGANLATLMAGNIAHVLAPAQRRRLAALRAGAAPDEAEARAAGARALHNQYLALPVIFFMLSGHAPLLFAGPHRIGVAVSALGAGFLIRRFFLKRARGLGWDWTLAASAAVLLMAMLALAWPRAPEETAAQNAGQAIARLVHPGPAAAQNLIEEKCGYCHAAAPVWPGLATAPAGLDLTDRDMIEKKAAAILRAAVLTSAMPPPGASAPLDEEDKVLLWRALR
ncbi:putative membrane protein [Rhodoblastus sphagnicola]|nr:urate hydroxylase PuuD [Rhodoblastus sphagnicola]MBB4196756.1 putative membrane protein [Rhodoblastus sphagnicola]